MRTNLVKVFFCSVMFIGVSLVLPSHAKGKPEKMLLCHLNDEGGYNLLNLPQGGYIGHLMHHEADIVPVDGVCIEEVTYEIGDTGPGGGIVFYVDPDDATMGLEAAPVDQGTAQWGCLGTDIPGAGGTVVGTGEQNTSDILVGCAETGIAARVADNYVLNTFADWFLPSKNELNSMYTQLHLNGVGGFASDSYWSSSEYSAGNAWLQYFNGGDQYSIFKVFTTRVRAVRAF